MYEAKLVPAPQNDPRKFQTYEEYLEAERLRLLDENHALAALNRELNVRVDALSDIITESVARDHKGFTLWLLSKHLKSFFR